MGSGSSGNKLDLLPTSPEGISLNKATRIVGSYLSPYVRKVLVCLHIKQITYEIDPIVPFFGDEKFSSASPLRRVPVLIDGDMTLADSTVICEYLEERYPSQPLFPLTVSQRARCRWLEEYADSFLGEVFIWHFFNQLVIRRFVWQEQPDHALVKKALEHDIPQLLNYLEAELPSSGYFFGSITMADIAVAAFFRNAGFARWSIDSKQWPKVSTWLGKVLAHEAFASLRRFEEISLTTPIENHRMALAQAGAPISPETFFTSNPRRGVFTI